MFGVLGISNLFCVVIVTIHKVQCKHNKTLLLKNLSSIFYFIFSAECKQINSKQELGEILQTQLWPHQNIATIWFRKLLFLPENIDWQSWAGAGGPIMCLYTGSFEECLWAIAVLQINMAATHSIRLAISCTDAKVMYYFLRVIWQTQQHKSFLGVQFPSCALEILSVAKCSSQSISQTGEGENLFSVTPAQGSLLSKFFAWAGPCESETRGGRGAGMVSRKRCSRGESEMAEEKWRGTVRRPPCFMRPSAVSFSLGARPPHADSKQRSAVKLSAQELQKFHTLVAFIDNSLTIVHHLEQVWAGWSYQPARITALT